MFKNFKHYTSVALCFARLAIQRQIEYPLFLVSWLIMIPLQYFGGILIIKLLISNFQSLNGWDFKDIAFIYGLGLISHGIQVVFFIQTWNIGRMVIRGDFDRILLRPMNSFFLFISRYINFIGLIDLIPGVIIFIWGCSLVQFHFSFFNIVRLVIVIIGGVLIRTSIFLSVGSVSFWTKTKDVMVGFIVQIFQRTTLYPIAIYPYMLQAFLTFIIPIGFISFYPASEFLNKEKLFQIPLDLTFFSLVIGILSFVISYIVFKSGLRNYESAGN